MNRNKQMVMLDAISVPRTRGDEPGGGLQAEKSMTDIKDFKVIKENMEINDAAIETVSGLLERLKSGEALAVAFVEAKKGGLVSTYSNFGIDQYHHIVSGCTRLTQRVAKVED